MKTLMYFFMLVNLMLVPSFVEAQTFDSEFTTSGGLSVSYSSAWSPWEDAPRTLTLSNPDGWTISIAAGIDAFYNYGTPDAFADASVVMANFAELMQLGEVTFDDVDTPIQFLETNALQRMATRSDGVVFEVVAFNLPDGTAVLAFLGSNSAEVSISTAMQAEFESILATIRVDDVEVIDDTATDDNAIFVPEGATLIDDLEPGNIQFAYNVAMDYPEGWTLYSDEMQYIDTTATLFYGDSMFSYEAFAVITVQDSADLSVEMFVESLMSINAMMYTEQEDYDVERDIIREVQPDGREILYLDTSNAEIALGNTIVVPLDARYWAWIMVTTISTDNAQNIAHLEEVLEMARSFRFVDREDALVFEDFMLDIVPVTCERVLTSEDVNEAAPYGIFECPSNCVEQGYGVWGTDIYTLDSSICATAVHAGAISDATGGIVMVTWLPGQDAYIASDRNGVSTFDYGYWNDSFMVEPFIPDDQ